MKAVSFLETVLQEQEHFQALVFLGIYHLVIEL